MALRISEFWIHRTESIEHERCVFIHTKILIVR
jgi:hypothetical protein